MKKRVSILIAAALFVTGVMSGCGNKEKADSVSKVTVWSSDGSAKALWTELVKEFNETTGKKKGIEVEWVTYGAADYSTIVDVARQNGQLPEICTLTNNQAKEFAATGEIISIEDIEGGKEFAEEYNSVKVTNVNWFNNKYYGFLSSINTAGLIYNKDLFKRAGIVDENGEAVPPKTLAEVREYAKIITDASKGIYGYSFPWKNSNYYTLNAPLTRAFGEGNYDYDNLTVDVSGISNRIKWIMGLKEDGSLFPGVESLDNDTSRAYFAEGNIGMMSGVSWDVGVLTTQFVAKCDWDVVPFPTEDGEDTYPSWVAYGGSYNITANAKKLPDEKILEVYKFIYSLNTRKTFYEKGISIPAKSDAIEAADASNIPKQLISFTKLYEEGQTPKIFPSLKTEGEADETVWRKVFAGEIPIDEAAADIAARNSAALRKGVENGDIDVSLYK